MYPSHLYPTGSKHALFDTCVNCYLIRRTPCTSLIELFNEDGRLSNLAVPLDQYKHFVDLSTNIYLCNAHTLSSETKWNDVLFCAKDTSPWDSTDVESTLSPDEYDYFEGYKSFAFLHDEITSKKISFKYIDGDGNKLEASIIVNYVHKPTKYNYYHFEFYNLSNETGEYVPIELPIKSKKKKAALKAIRTYLIECVNCFDAENLNN